MAVLEIPDDLYDALKAEAAQSHAGDITELVRSGLNFWTRLTNPLNLPLHLDQDAPQRPDLAVLQRLMGENLVPIDTVASLGRTFSDAAGLLHEGRRQPASSYLEPYLSWVGNNPSSRALIATVLSVQAASGDLGAQGPGVVSVANGYLSGNGITVTGTLRQTFSDRTTNTGQAFDIGGADELGVEVTVSPEGNGFCDITLIAKSWGGARQTLRDPEQLGGVVIAKGDSVGSQVPEAVYALSLNTFDVPG